VTTKPQKTEAELKELLLQEVRKQPALQHIQGVFITRPVQESPHHPNWDFGWVCDGGSLAPPTANQIGRNLQNQFDLKFPS
jgi:hypothetical protein